MRFVKIETNTGSYEFVNVEQITSVSSEASVIVVSMSDGSMIRTKFTDLDHAVDFIQRASQPFSPSL